MSRHVGATQSCVIGTKAGTANGEPGSPARCFIPDEPAGLTQRQDGVQSRTGNAPLGVFCCFETGDLPPCSASPHHNSVAAPGFQGYFQLTLGTWNVWKPEARVRHRSTPALRAISPNLTSNSRAALTVSRVTKHVKLNRNKSV